MSYRHIRIRYSFPAMFYVLLLNSTELKGGATGHINYKEIGDVVNVANENITTHIESDFLFSRICGCECFFFQHKCFAHNQEIISQ